MRHNETAAVRSSFSGKAGYVLAAAGSAVGLGNIWRFPYLAAKYGGGMFLLVYLILMLTFGYALIISETAIGRMTKKSPVGAFRSFGSGAFLKFGGWLNALTAMLIVPYYCTIGGWVTKYLFEYIRGGTNLADEGYFSLFTASAQKSVFWFIVFFAAVFIVVALGVEKGIERVSKITMPLLIVLAVFISIYSITRPGAAEGVRYFLVPDFSHFSWMTIVAAAGQMFYSLSIAMGILYTFGSYMKKDVDIEKATTQVEFFDTAIAVLSGLMVIPAVFALSGEEALTSGPPLMFITLPKVFANMDYGALLGLLFFLLVFFAALTSAISLAECGVSTFSDQTGKSRTVCCVYMGIIILVLGTLSALSMSVLDFFDFLTNSLMMPVAALATAFLVVRYVKIKGIAAEVENSSAFKHKKMYAFYIKYLVPVCTVVILIAAALSVMGLIKI